MGKNLKQLNNPTHDSINWKPTKPIMPGQRKYRRNLNYLEAIIRRMRSKILVRGAINEKHRASMIALDQTRKMKTRQIEELSDPSGVPKY